MGPWVPPEGRKGRHSPRLISQRGQVAPEGQVEILRRKINAGSLPPSTHAVPCSPPELLRAVTRLAGLVSTFSADAL